MSILGSRFQYAHLKSSLLDTEVLFLNLTKHFNLFDTGTIPGNRLIDNFPDLIFFYSCNCSSLSGYKSHLESLDCLHLEASSSSSILIVVTNTSARLPKNMQAVSTMYFWRPEQQLLFSKAIANLTTTLNAELFAIRLNIVKATIIDIKYIILITNFLGSIEKNNLSTEQTAKE